MSALRIPLAAAFLLVAHTGWRLAIVAAAAVTDLLDGPIARRWGSSAYGPVLDPIADKVFMASAFGVVAFSGRLAPYEIVGVLLRDIVATVAFVATFFSDQPSAIPGAMERQGRDRGADPHAGGISARAPPISGRWPGPPR